MCERTRLIGMGLRDMLVLLAGVTATAAQGSNGAQTYSSHTIRYIVP